MAILALVEHGSTPGLPPVRGGTGTSGGPLDRTRGKILFYWGCGEKVGPGQPLVIDMAAPGANTRLPGEGLRAASQPSATSHPRYVDWPNRVLEQVDAGYARLVAEYEKVLRSRRSSPNGCMYSVTAGAWRVKR